MFSYRVTYYPALGKGPELRTALEARAKERQAQGFRTGLSTQLFGADGATYILTFIWPDLAGYEKFRQGNQSDPAFRAFQNKLVELTRMPTRVELFEILVPTPPADGARATFATRFTSYPAAGKGPEVRAALEERVKARQAQALASTYPPNCLERTG